jgi:hypothetical protein
MHLRHLFVSAIALLGFCPAAALADGGPIMPLSQVQAGMDCTGDTVVQGTTITTFKVHVISVVQASGEGPRILVSVSGPAVDATGIAEGFSGSPVYCPGPGGTMENAGAISEGVGEYGNKVGLVTPIQQMLGEPVKPPAGAPRLAVRAHPLLGPLTVSGLSPALLHALQVAGERVGRQVVAAPAAPFTSFPLQPLVAGASVGVSYSTGTIGVGAIGTVTYRDGQTVYAFGHPLDEAGRRALLLQDAYVYDVINNPDPLQMPSYKYASPGHTEGTLTSDSPSAVVGQVGAAPSLIPVDVIVHDLDTGRVLDEQTQVADETDVGLPLGTSLLDTVAPLAVGQAATDIYDGPPANQSGRMCLTVSLRESRHPLQFCNRYVGSGGPATGTGAPPELANATTTDVTTALALLDAEQFRQLHVTKVLATIYAQRGLADAAIVAAHGPRRAKAGHTVRVRLLVRRFRGGLQTIRFKLRLPRRLHGSVLVTIRGAQPPPSPSGGSGSAPLSILLSASLTGGSQSSNPPTSMADLRKQLAGIANYDGLQASFSGHKTERAYRDPALLITGHARLALMVGK